MVYDVIIAGPARSACSFSFTCSPSLSVTRGRAGQGRGEGADRWDPPRRVPSSVLDL